MHVVYCRHSYDSFRYCHRVRILLPYLPRSSQLAIAENAAVQVQMRHAPPTHYRTLVSFCQGFCLVEGVAIGLRGDVQQALKVQAEGG
jgi:hypothetical protein